MTVESMELMASIFSFFNVSPDISIECFARNLHNQGTMAVIHRQDKI
jgi:hypothetical protein